MMNYKKLSIGFIGAGRVGTTLGRYFYEKNLLLSGYFSKTYEHACEAAEFTSSKPFSTIEELLNESQIVFITVPDSNIFNVYNQIKEYKITNKIICHCSGALSAAVFDGAEQKGAFCYSIHPAFAVSDKKGSYKQLSNAFFTVEGSEEQIHIIKELFKQLGNSYQIINAENKYKYHAALASASNLVAALYNISAELLAECGFSEESAAQVLNPLFLNNAENICKMGCMAALTGPVDRNDFLTVKKHLSVLSDDVQKLYSLLSSELVKIAEYKYPERNYDDLKKLLYFGD